MELSSSIQALALWLGPTQAGKIASQTFWLGRKFCAGGHAVKRRMPLVVIAVYSLGTFDGDE
jgi:hypothetical protein